MNSLPSKRPNKRAQDALRQKLAAGIRAVFGYEVVETPTWANDAYTKLAVALEDGQMPDIFAPGPPIFFVCRAETVNAFAAPGFDENRNYVKDENGKFVPVVVATVEILKEIIKDQPDRFAFVMGHELGHHVLGHTRRFVEQDKKPITRGVLGLAIGRQDELDCDAFGVKLMLKAGFSLEKGRRAFLEMRGMFPNESWEFVAVPESHPTMTERLEQITTDVKQKKLWGATASWETGVNLLALQQFLAAESCFANIVKEFPMAGDAWANEGYALLMQYCDALTPADIRGWATKYRLGHVATDGFYQRPAWLEVRTLSAANAAPTWRKAVDTLQRSAQVDKNLILPVAWMGLAQLLNPSGPNVAEARKWLTQAATMADADSARPAKERQLSPAAREAIQINLACAVAARTGGEAEALKILSKLQPEEELGPLSGAVLFNRASLKAKSAKKADRKEARADFVVFLANEVPSSPYYPLAKERYEAVCKVDGEKPQVVKVKNAVLRPTFTYAVASGVNLTLLEPEAAVEARLGMAKIARTKSVPLAENGFARKVTLADKDVDLLYAGSKLVAIHLTGPNAEPVHLRGRGPGAPVQYAKIGMKVDELQKLIVATLEEAGKDPIKARFRFGLTTLYPGSKPFVFILPLALGIGIDEDTETITDLILTRAPAAGREV